MFSSRKYSALPTTAGGSSPSMNRRRGGGGLGQWKKYFIIFTVGVVALLFLAGGHAGKQYMSGGSEGGSEAQLQHGYESDFDYDEYASPPLVPDGNGISYGAEGADAEVDEDVEGALHILPFPPPSAEDDNEGLEYGNPQQNDHSHAELPDFTDIDSLEQDDYPSQTEQESADEESTEEEGQSGPTSFETDPDPESTTYCSRPHSADKPIVQYALTIDAGSTGSRIHVYKFHNCGPSPTLEYETFKAIQPGLSSFARDPTAAAASLDPLMEEALRVVPESLHKCSPVEVKATAGLRLLPGREGQAILDEVRQRLEVDYPFSLSKDESAVEIMDGKDEGVYAWITANYLLGKIGSGTKESSTDSTMAVMDLGGASTQIVFEPQFASTEELAEGDHKYALSFGGRDFVLYQHSYLGYGLMRARRSVHNLVAFTWSFLQPGGAANIDWDELNEEHSVPNPCLATGTTKRVELDPPGRKTVNVTMLGVDGGFESCNRVVELVMAKDAICEVKPCSFNGVYQPSLLDTFPHGQLLALSYFTDRIQPLLGPYSRKNKAGKNTLTIGTLASMAKDVCAGPKVWERKWKGDAKALAELEDRPEYCLDLTFMHALLGLGYELGEDRQLVVEKKLRGVELGWALGAGIALLEKATLTCTA